MDKDIEKILDSKEEGTSNCCNGQVVNDICMDCGEPCKSVIEDDTHYA
jgi:hypothetical protein